MQVGTCCEEKLIEESASERNSKAGTERAVCTCGLSERYKGILTSVKTVARGGATVRQPMLSIHSG